MKNRLGSLLVPRGEAVVVNFGAELLCELMCKSLCEAGGGRDEIESAEHVGGDGSRWRENSSDQPKGCWAAKFSWRKLYRLARLRGGTARQAGQMPGPDRKRRGN